MEKEYAILRLKDIHADEEFNCRGSITPLDVIDLAKDMQQRGQLQPILVTKYSPEDADKFGFKYRLIAGFRRYMAMKVNNSKDIDTVILLGKLSEADALYLNLSENVQRKDLNIMQEALALKKLKVFGITEHAAAEKLGKSRGWIQVRYMLLALPESVQEQVAAGFIGQSGIRDLYAVNRTSGNDKCVETAVNLKKVKIANLNKPRMKKKDINKNNPTIKKMRTRVEIFEMQDHIFDALGNGLFTRCLAWASGEICDNELFESIKEEAIILDVPYSPPDSL